VHIPCVYLWLISCHVYIPLYVYCTHDSIIYILENRPTFVPRRDHVSIYKDFDITFAFPCTHVIHMTRQSVYMKTDLYMYQKRPNICIYHICIYNDSDLTFIFPCTCLTYKTLQSIYMKTDLLMYKKETKYVHIPRIYL